MTHVHVHVYVIFILFLSCTHKFYQLRIIFKAALARPHAGSMYSRTAAGRPRSHGRRLGMPPKMSAWRFGRYSSFLFSPPPTPLPPPPNPRAGMEARLACMDSLSECMRYVSHCLHANFCLHVALQPCFARTITASKLLACSQDMRIA